MNWCQVRLFGKSAIFLGCLSLAIALLLVHFHLGLKCTVNSCQMSLAQLNQEAKVITVKVLSKDFLGSGIIVQKEKAIYTVLTNAHVLLAGDSPYRIQTWDGHIYSTNIEKEKMKNFQTDISHISHGNFLQGKDLALLQFSDTNITYNTCMFGSQPSVGDEVFAAGFPIGENNFSNPNFTLTMGKVSLLLPKALVGGYQLGYTNEIQKGMSGGPLLNRRAQVVGVNGIHANPLWDSRDRFVDGSDASSNLHQQISTLSWAVPINKF
jgi:S1-C subfamily serine protease